MARGWLGWILRSCLIRLPVSGVMAQDLTICEAVWSPHQDSPDIGSDAFFHQRLG